MSGALRDDKADAIRASGASVVATANPGCAMQLAAASDAEIVHPVELLDRAYSAAGAATVGWRS